MKNHGTGIESSDTAAIRSTSTVISTWCWTRSSVSLCRTTAPGVVAADREDWISGTRFSIVTIPTPQPAQLRRLLETTLKRRQARTSWAGVPKLRFWRRHRWLVNSPWRRLEMAISRSRSWPGQTASRSAGRESVRWRFSSATVRTNWYLSRTRAGVCRWYCRTRSS